MFLNYGRHLSVPDTGSFEVVDDRGLRTKRPLVYIPGWRCWLIDIDRLKRAQSDKSAVYKGPRWQTDRPVLAVSPPPH